MYIPRGGTGQVYPACPLAHPCTACDGLGDDEPPSLTCTPAHAVVCSELTRRRYLNPVQCGFSSGPEPADVSLEQMPRRELAAQAASPCQLGSDIRRQPVPALRQRAALMR
ncbi:hypothetical protein NDU88_000558 [Pleurodeles waltl]|uniref:Uncharacterized protein n=1 Tax=Pleurodeles waltl TaxID=8319 RepID=A0AAV7V796_PLEWA|nr:hypothetical protein NDU88_000558 [Pleurodeles waltl]